MKLEQLVNIHYDSLTANDREMLNLIFKEKQDVRHMNSTQLASFLHVSRTTLVRLMKKLGISTYAEFRLLLEQEEAQRADVTFDVREIVKNYHRMIDELKNYDYENVCKILYEADTIYLYGTGNEQKAVAEEFKRIFLLLGKRCIDLFDFGEIEFARKNFRETDVFLAISLSGETPEAIRIMRYVISSEIQTISLTRWENNSLSRMCRESLYAGTRTVRHGKQQTYELVAAFYIMIDILSVRYLEYQEKREKAREGEHGR